MRSVGMNSPVGAGSQLASSSLPGDSFRKYSVIEPSGFAIPELPPGRTIAAQTLNFCALKSYCLVHVLFWTFRHAYPHILKR